MKDDENEARKMKNKEKGGRGGREKGRTNSSSCIDDLGVILDTSVLDHLGEGVFDRGVVAVHKVVFDKLDGDTGLSCHHRHHPSHRKKPQTK